MKLQAEVNSTQLDEVDVTITVKMKLKEWKMISKSLRVVERKSGELWTKEELSDLINEVVDEYTSKVERTIEKKNYAHVD